MMMVDMPPKEAKEKMEDYKIRNSNWLVGLCLSLKRLFI